MTVLKMWRYNKRGVSRENVIKKRGRGDKKPRKFLVTLINGLSLI